MEDAEPQHTPLAWEEEAENLLPSFTSGLLLLHVWPVGTGSPAWGCAGLLRRNQRSWPRQHGRRKQHSRLTMASVTQDALVPLGLDFLTFLAATVLVIPIFKSVKASPILGFLFSGLLLGQLG